MNLVSSITRAPHLFDTSAVEDVTQRFASHPNDVSELLVGTASASPYLRGLILRHADWLESAMTSSMGDVLQVLSDFPADKNIAELKIDFRDAKSKLALIVGLADLGGAFELEDVTRA